ncbi:hypothetical protein LTR62_000262 [Meristemomyces frigidus]|uniref:Zn(2)-C6 fungal-type domain-containing protein n=1 Tax=Meristemomyces frigidus TaxID=1508187 RepID=A0AAN7YUQ6_9PEZI|nr:hypothetical protein LTR62_000262 [Meristemomyces frigidus]
MSSTSERPKKLQRISQACDLCHRRSIRCRPSAENARQQCQNCFDFAVECTYNRPSRRRRNPSVPYSTSPNVLPGAGQQTGVSPSDDSHESKGQEVAVSQTINRGWSNSSGQQDYIGAYETVRQDHSSDVLGVAWRSFAEASMSTIEQYVDIYMEVVYPLFPLFHGPTFREKLAKRDHLTDRGFFAATMAACALAAARARDGAMGDRSDLKQHSERSSEVFFAAAKDTIPKELEKAQCQNYMRASGLLALCSIQYGQINTMHRFMGIYTTLAAMTQFHDEAYWPSTLTNVEREERRRVYWSMYTLQVYVAVVFDGLVMTQEIHSNVKYPSAVDEDITVKNGLAAPDTEENWLQGWNFTTDLYRVLEYSITRMRRLREGRLDRVSVVRLLDPVDLPDSVVMDNVIGLYYQLSARFRNYNVPITGDQNQDMFGFQAANIQATLQLVRMTLFSTNTNHDVYQKCYVAEQVLTTFHSIAPQYLRAISTPLVYHLGGIGRILGSVMEGLLCEQSYQRVRALLVSMADLLQGLESGLQPTAGSSRDLRLQIEKIDRYMEAQRLLISSVAGGQQQQQQQQSSQQLQTDALPGITLPHAHAALPPSSMARLGMGTPLDEFQLPPDLVDGKAWPWPFDFSPADQYSLLQQGPEG